MEGNKSADRVAGLSDAELKSELEKIGENVGPITSSTRPILERLLLRRHGNAAPDTHSKPENGQDESPSTENCAVFAPVSVVHVYFGVYPPDGLDVSGDPEFHQVYTDKIACLAIMKKYKGSRFKAFKSYDEALQFAENGPDLAMVQDVGGGQDTNVNAERPSPYRGPRSQDLVKFRKSIEKEDLNYFRKCINENPRYLVSSGDTPAILQEGSRYNALHVACRTDKPKYAAEVLSTIAQVEFFQKLYPDDTRESSQRRSTYLLDLYLNTPDKGLNETPLHFASKHSSLECVRVLTSYPACNKLRKNKFGQVPADIICTRVNNSTSKIREDIQCLLGEQFYVPLFRDDGHCLLPQVGAPWSPGYDSPTSPATQDQLLMAYTSDDSSSPISPSLKVRGFAGPMSPTKAEVFHRRWKANSVSSPMKGRVASLRLTDQDKGLERIGRDLASSEGIPWNEYWEFLGDFANLRMEEGLMKLESFMKEKYKMLMMEQGKVDAEELAAKLGEEVRLNSPGKNGSPQGDAANDQHNISGVSKSSQSTLSELCQELEALRLNVSLSPQLDTQCYQSASSKFLESWKEKEEKQINKGLEEIVQMPEDSATEQLSYIMKSVRVAAHRMADLLGDLAQDLQSNTITNLSVTKALKSKLKPEISCLRRVVSRGYTDELQNALDFRFIHVLLAFKVTQTIQQNLTSSDVCILAETLKVFVSHLNFMQVHSSDEEEASELEVEVQARQVAQEHFNCLLKCLEKALNIVYNNNSDIQDGASEDTLKLHFMQIGDCRCRWKDFSEQRKAVIPQQTPTTTTKYNKAFNFLHKTLFSIGKPPNGSASDVAETQGGIVKKLSFDEEGEEVIQATLSIKDGGDIMETLVMQRSEEKAPLSCGGSAHDNDSFETAPSSIGDSMITPEEGIKVFMYGSEPSKVDMDVMEAMGDLKLDEDKYPYLAQWYHLMSCHTDKERNSWTSPYYSRTPRRTSMCSTLSPLSQLSTPDLRGRSLKLDSTPLSQLGTPNGPGRSFKLDSTPRKLFNQNGDRIG